MIVRTTSQLVWDGAMLGVWAYSLWRGGRPERVISTSMVLGSVATAVVENRQDWVDPQLGIMAVDLAFLLIAGWYAFRSDRHWPMWAAAFQLIAIVTHLAMGVDHKVSAWAYLTAGVIWSYLILAAMAVGTWAYSRRIRTFRSAKATVR